MKKIFFFRRFIGTAGFHCLVLLVAAAVYTPNTRAQTFRNTVTGFVWDQGRTPVTNIPVEVMNEVNQVLQRTKTDGSGRYFFGGLSAGRFSIRVLPYGTNFEEQTGEVEIVNFVRPGSSTSENAQKDFYLRVRKSGSDVRAVTGTVFAQDVPEKARKEYERAMTEFDANRTDAAIAALMSAVTIFPEYFVALERLGREYVKQEKYDYAWAAFMKTVSVNERSFNGWYGLGYSSYALKNSKTAVPATRKAVELDPSSVDAVLLLGICERQDKQYAAAERSLLLAKKLSNGQKADVHWNLALLYANNLERYKDAADELELYLKIAPPEAKVENVRKLITQFREKAASAK